VQNVHQWICGLYGHRLLMHFEPSRVSMRCGWCGYETPGWEIAPMRRGQSRPVMRSQNRPVPLVKANAEG
jgi:hypothetical protein